CAVLARLFLELSRPLHIADSKLFRRQFVAARAADFKGLPCLVHLRLHVVRSAEVLPGLVDKVARLVMLAPLHRLLASLYASFIFAASLLSASASSLKAPIIFSILRTASCALASAASGSFWITSLISAVIVLTTSLAS